MCFNAQQLNALLRFVFFWLKFCFYFQEAYITVFFLKLTSVLKLRITLFFKVFGFVENTE